MITIYAEKNNLGIKIASALGNIEYKGKKLDPQLADKYIEELKKMYNPKGYIEIEFNGEPTFITWGSGHMYELKHAKDYNPDYVNWKKIPIPFFPDTYDIKMKEGFDLSTKKSTGKPNPSTLRQINIVKELFNKSSLIINATDDDREGELIFAYLYQEIGKGKPYKRVRLNSQTKKGFIEAFDKLIDSSDVKSKEDAGRGRSNSDFAVGINITALMTLKYAGGSIKTLPAGRVLTPLTNIVVEREKEIQSFVSHPFWYIMGLFDNEKDKFEAKHEISQILDKKDAEELLNKVNGNKGEVITYETKPFSKDVPELYDLNFLAVDASREYGFTAVKTLELAQELYSAGYITYPRTKATHLTDDMKPTVDGILDMLSEFPQYEKFISPIAKVDRNYTKRHFDSAKVESHYAIIPTEVKPDKITPDQEKLYDLIAKSLIRIIYKPAKFEKTEIIIDVKDEKFKTNGNVLIEANWMVVDAMPPKDKILPLLSVGEILNGEYSIIEGKTSPPKRFTDDTFGIAVANAGRKLDDKELIKIMADRTVDKDMGLGTPATRPALIEKMFQVGYAKREKGKIYATETGMKMIDLLPCEEMKSALLTAQWEKRLNLIEEGKETLNEFINDIEIKTREWCDQIKAAKDERLSVDKFSEPCPNCGKPLIKIKSGLICSGYKKDDPSSCKFYVPYNIASKSLSENDIKDLICNKKTKYITGFHKKDSKDQFGAYLILDENNAVKFSWDSQIACPKCGKPIKINPTFWGCSGYKEGCKFSINNIIASKTISDTIKKELIEKGITKKITGFKSKAGKDFSAKLKLDEEFKVVFDFEKGGRKNGG